jgi:ParB family chromosome partitioning protein
VKYLPHLERVVGLAVSGSGRLLALGGTRDAEGLNRSQVHLYRWPKLAHAGAIEVSGSVAALVFLEGELLLAGTSAGRIVGIDVSQETPVKLFEVEAHQGAIRALAVSVLGKKIVSAGDDGNIHLYELSSGTPTLKKLAGRHLSDRPVLSVVLDPSGSQLVAGGDDAVVRVVPTANFATAEIREMSAGESAVRALELLGDGRVAAGTADGAIKYLFLEGAVDEENRSGEHAHSGPIRALIRSPLLLDEAERELPRRLYSVGEDGELKSWQLDTKRKPRTVELKNRALAAIVWVPPPPRAAKDKRGGTLVSAGRERKLTRLVLDGAGELGANPELEEFGSELERLAEDRTARGAQVREAAIRALGAIAEDEARVLLESSVEDEASVELRVLAIEMLGATERRQSRPALRRAIGDKHAFDPFAKPAANQQVRKAALEALLKLDQKTPLLPLRTALGSVHEDVRFEALSRLPSLRATSPLVPGLIAERLSDRSADVRLLAIDALVESEPKESLEPLRTALAKGHADVRLETVVRLGFHANTNALLESALDDADELVRSMAFLVLVARRKSLVSRLRAVDARIHDSLLELEKRGTFVEESSAGGEQKEPLFAALASRHADSALRAARSLALLGDARAVGALLQLSREAAREVRLAVVEALLLASRSLPGDDRPRTRLEWLLDDSEQIVRGAAFESLAKLAEPLELVKIALSASHQDVRVRALKILVDAKRSEDSEKLLADALDDEAANVRSEAFRTLWAWHPKDPRVPLERGAASRHADVRLRVVSELERQKAAWARPLLLALVKDATSEVGAAAYRALTKEDADKKRAEVHLAAMSSSRSDVRALGAAGSVHAPAAAVKNALVEGIREDQPAVHLAAIEAADVLLPDDEVPFAAALGSVFYELRVRAGELLGRRKNLRGVAAMKELLSIPKTRLDRPSDQLRHRAARALADAGDVAATPFLIGLLEDEDPLVREMGARGLATACRPGGEAPLVAALAHPDLPVRSWAAEGLARFGDVRALPVLAGTQQHSHRPIRIGAILGFVALGAEGIRGIFQGLADPDREIQDLVFAIIVARDRALLREGHAPDLLLAALSSLHPEIRFAAARALESRFSPEAYEELALELVGPKKPEKAGDLKKWPNEEKRRALVNLVVMALASDDPAKRYASAQVLSLRSQPESYFTAAERLKPASVDQTWVPHAGGAEEKNQPRKVGWIRRLFGKQTKPQGTVATAAERVLTVIRFRGATAHRPVPPASEGFSRSEATQLVFGAYAGLVRQAPQPGAADETHRLRRDSIERLTQLSKEKDIGRDAVLPILRRSLSDTHHLVRRSGAAALRALYPQGSLEPLSMALATSALDVGRDAIDELIALALAGNEEARRSARGAIEAPSAEVRAYAVGRLEKLSPKGSLEPWLFALESRYADVRSSVVDRLIGSDDPRVRAALGRAMESDHEDLRLKAAAALARRGVEASLDVLAPFLRSEELRVSQEALDALVALKSARAAEAIAQRIDEDPDKNADRPKLIDALSRIGDRAAFPLLLRLLEDEADAIRAASFSALKWIAVDKNDTERKLGAAKRPRYVEATALEFLAPAAKSPQADNRLRAAGTLDAIEDREAEVLLARLLGDRESEVRVTAAEAVAFRAEVFKDASIEPLRAALRQGRRELVLPAAAGLASKKRPEAFQPLLLVLKAGEGADRERALLALGTLGDPRALTELSPFLDPNAELSDEDRALIPALYETFGRMMRELPEGDERARISHLVERTAKAGVGPAQLRAITGLRFAGDERSRAVLEKIAADRWTDPNARKTAVEELGKLARPESEAVLSEALNEDDVLLRRAALVSLELLYAADPTRTNLLALSSRHRDISDPAASFLARKGDPKTLVRRLGEVKSAEARRRLRLGLVRRRLCPAEELDVLLRADAAGARAEAAWIAGAAKAEQLGGAVKVSIERSEAGYRREEKRLGGDRTFELEAWRAGFWAASAIGADIGLAARAAANDAETPAVVRAEAIRFMARHGRREDAKSLWPALGDRDARVRAAAAEAVGRLDPTVEAVTSTPMPDVARMNAIVRPLLSKVAPKVFATAQLRRLVLPVAIGDRTIAPLAELARAKGIGADRLAAIAALGRMGTAEAIEVLKAILAEKSEDDQVRASAYRALRRAERSKAKVYADGVDKEKRGRGGATFAGAAADDEEVADDEIIDDDGGDEETDFSAVNDEDEDEVEEDGEGDDDE